MLEVRHSNYDLTSPVGDSDKSLRITCTKYQELEITDALKWLNFFPDYINEMPFNIEIPFLLFCNSKSWSQLTEMHLYLFYDIILSSSVSMDENRSLDIQK